MREQQSRRNFLRNVGIASAGALSATTVVSASSENVSETIQSFLSQGKISEAQQVAEENGGELNTETVPLSESAEGDSSSGGVSTDNFWEDPANGESSLSVSIESGSWLNADYRAHAIWDLSEDDITFEGYNTCPPDAAALFWNGNYFVPESSGSGNFHTSDSEVSYGGIEAYNGILAEVNDPLPARDGGQESWSASFATDLNVAQSGASNYPIIMEYRHTYIDTAYTICGAASVSFSLGPGSITMSGDAQDWSNAAQNSI